LKHGEDKTQTKPKTISFKTPKDKYCEVFSVQREKQKNLGPYSSTQMMLNKQSKEEFQNTEDTRDSIKCPQKRTTLQPNIRTTVQKSIINHCRLSALRRIPHQDATPNKNTNQAIRKES
jgi:hypothetical protein